MRRAICLLTAAAMALQATGIAFASYTYDDAGRTETIDKFGETTTFEYDEASRPEKMIYDTGAYALYTYDGRSRIKAVEHKNSSNTLLRKETNVYDPASRITSRYEGPASGGVTTTFGYDDAGQLTSESSSGYSASYTYDANGNRTNRTVNGVSETYTVDDSDKLTSVTWSQGGNNYAKEYAYHYSGRPTSITLKTNGVTTATRTFTWDKESRITALTDGTTSASYVYNGFTARTSKTVGGTSTTYKRAGASAVSPVVADITGGTTTNHLPGISSRAGGTSTFSHSGIKNGVLQTNSSQTNTGTKRYDAFGNVLNATGSWATQFSYGGPFGYQSDSEFGYQLLGHRYYDPSTGRFLTRDPAKDGRNWYGYCGGNPVAHADPSGHIPPLIAAAIPLIITGIKIVDTALAVKDIIEDPTDPWNYVGLLCRPLKKLRMFFESADAVRDVGTVAKISRGGAGPVRKGQEGVQKSIAMGQERGDKLVGTEISVETASGRRGRIDVVFEKKEGGLDLRESKNGPFAKRTPNQKELHDEIEKSGGTFYGGNAQEVGLGPLNPTPVIVDKH